MASESPSLPPKPTPVASVPEAPLAIDPVSVPEDTAKAPAPAPEPVPTPAVQNPVAADAGEATGWRGKTSVEDRKRIVDSIVDVLQQLRQHTHLPRSDLWELAQNYENDQFNKCATRQEYSEKIRRKLAKLKDSANPPPPSSSSKPTPPVPHSAKSGSAGAAVDWKCSAPGMALSGRQSLVAKDLTCMKGVLTESNTTWASSMLFNPAKASMRPGRPIGAIEKIAKWRPVGAVCFTKQQPPRPVMLAHMDTGGSPTNSNNTLVAMLYNTSGDGKVPANQVCFDYEGPDAVSQGLATLAQLTTLPTSHGCRLHPHVGPMAWSASKCFENFSLKNATDASELPPFRRFMVVVLPRADESVEGDFEKLVSKNPDSSITALNKKMKDAVDADDSFAFSPATRPTIPNRLLKRSNFYPHMIAYARMSSDNVINKQKIGEKLAIALSTGYGTKPVRPSADDSEEEEMVVAPKPKAKSVVAGKRGREAADEEAGEDDQGDSSCDDSDAEPEDRKVAKKRRGIKAGARPKPMDSDAENGGDESDEDEDELSDDDEEDDAGEDDEDDEDAMDVVAAEHAGGSIGDELPAKKPVAAPSVKGAKSTGSVVAHAAISKSVKKASGASGASAAPAAPPTEQAQPQHRPSPHQRRVLEAIAVAKQHAHDGLPTIMAEVKRAGYASFEADIEQWWARRLAMAQVGTESASAPKPAKSNTAPETVDKEQVYVRKKKEAGASTAEVRTVRTDHNMPPPVQRDHPHHTKEQLDWVYKSQGGGRDHAATERRRLACEFYNQNGILGDSFNDHAQTVLPFMPKSFMDVAKVGKETVECMTSLALDEKKLRYNEAIQGLLNYNHQVSSCLVTLMKAYASKDAKSGASSSSAPAPPSGVQKAVSATATNLVKLTPQVAELGAVLSRVSGDFNSIVAKMNADALAIAEAMEQAHSETMRNGCK